MSGSPPKRPYWHPAPLLVDRLNLLLPTNGSFFRTNHTVTHLVEMTLKFYIHIEVDTFLVQ